MFNFSRRGGGRGSKAPSSPSQPAKTIEEVVADMTLKQVPTDIKSSSLQAGTTRAAIAASITVPTVSRKEREMMNRCITRWRATTPIYDIFAVQFRFMSDRFIRDHLSVVSCQSVAISGPTSVNSPKMGTIDQTHSCQTCGLVGIDCPGHMGFIDLAVPLPNPLIIGVIADLMQCLCSNCGKLLVPQERRAELRRFRGVARIKEAAKIVLSLGSVMCPRNIVIAKGGIVEGTATVGLAPCTTSFPGNPSNANLPCPSIIIKYTAPRTSNDWKITATIPTTSSSSLAVAGGGATPGARTKHISHPVPIDHIECVFNAMVPQDLAVLGFFGDNHPRNFILRSLPVIPERNRPPIEQNGAIKYDHLTCLYIQIIRVNQHIRDMKTTANKTRENYLDEAIGRLYFMIYHFFSNSDGQFKIYKDIPAQTVGTRLSGKEGLCRASAQGKRVNNSGRTVIGPGVIPFGTVAIPSVMRTITLPERANRFNLVRLRALARKGEIIHIVSAQGPFRGEKRRFAVVVSEAETRKAPFPDIQIGDLVHRLAQTGDDVIINRQPTLHRHSFIGTSALFVEGQKTMKIHMSYTPILNADFDGDEMNVSFPQTNRARAEVRYLLGATEQLINSAESQASMGLVFNHPSTVYLLSTAPRDVPIMAPFEWEELISTYLIEPSRSHTLSTRLAAERLLERTPRALFSLVFPDDFYYARKYKTDEGKAEKVLIRKGIFVEGTLTKGDVAKGIIVALHQRYGPETAGRFICEAQFILDWYLERRGFSIGLWDCMLEDRKKARKEVEVAISIATNNIDALNVEPAVTQTEITMREIETQSHLQSINNVGRKLAKASIAGAHNPLGVMINSGAKGGPNNMAQIAGCLGQQFVNGERLPLILPGARASPFFEKGETSLESRGFIRQSFSDGMTPSSFFAHMNGARLGLVDTSVHTAEIGALTHKMHKVLENETIGYFGGVISTNWVITSPAYGEGYSPRELILVKGFISTGDVYLPFDLRALVEELNDS